MGSVGMGRENWERGGEKLGIPSSGIVWETGKDWREWGGENGEFSVLGLCGINGKGLSGTGRGKSGIKARIQPGIVPALEFPFPAAAGSEGMAEAGI